ncbi:MAG: phosphate-starvation-inducible PsiE family protein [Bacteroidales bacterium]|nr:phosphate-starvation-inducible PsiE family protein [Bacteroidales bacterium]
MPPNSKIEKTITSGENIIYIVIIILLFASAALLIYDEIKTFIHVTDKSFGIKLIIEIIAKTLLLLMIIEILTTVRISIREHTLSAEPFLIVGLIASIRRILIISVETAYVPEYFNNFMIEIGVLTGLIFVFIISIVLLKKYNIK